ncbi:MAG: response regulator [Candidatus Aminicenantes bacterium]|nr:response regulator [Candidatus Aminicenantes bacterium]NIM85143.1 response regulator [Candidatus Aminicenantes bacterium]NIN24653.1 response regulator [Candidatus Aminicenantes bacterium]NIN48414.1 response regulator [Candidatus Aminicenantes bacterium]NIN91317.1 response regulator [Candidatus Aminicenantes bacterium]
MKETAGKILIAEDETIVALDIKKKLVKLGYNVTDIVSTGEEAIEKAGETTPDLILMDISLEGDMDGIEAAKRIRSRYDIPIIYLTAHSDKKTLDRAKVTEPWGYIVKPFERGSLHATIEMAIYKHQVKRKLEEKDEERNRLLAYLEQARKMEALGTLAGGIAHDFNNILSIILGFTELSISELSEEEPIYPNLKNVINACFRARDVVKQILTFSHPGEKQIKPVKVSSIVGESLKFLQSSIPSTIEIRQNITTAADVVLGDAAEINQVLINLCSNAVYAMRKEGGVLEVTLEDLELKDTAAIYLHDLNPGHYVRLTVTDTGYGMEEVVLERIFEPYFTTKEVGEGTGMGLALVHGIVKKHDGAVTVQSEPGKGTTFQVYLPISDKAISADTDIKTTGLIPRGDERILFVDDEKEVVDMAKRMLEYLGYHVETKINGLEALDMFKSQSQQFDLVITDLIMPKISGTAFAREISKIKPGISIIICTGFREKINKEEVENIGIDAVLLKPIVMHEIAQTIRNVLDKEK